MRLQKAFEQLNLELGNASDPNDKIYGFYKQFKNNDVFNLDELIVFGVFVCSGKPEDKAHIWFDIFDSDLKGIITKIQIFMFVKLLFKITYKLLPKLAIKDIGVTELQIYLERADIHSENFSNFISDLLCKNHYLDKPGFIAKIVNNYKISYTDGFRSLYKQYLALIKK